MPRKVRNHALEYARRNELAVGRGFRSRGQQRYAIETGHFAALDFRRIRSPKTRKAQEGFLSAPRFIPKYAGVEVPKYTPEQRCIDWSAAFARSEKAQYEPDNASDLGLTKAEYRKAYMKAFVSGKERYKLARKTGSDALRHWFVDINHYFEADEYETRYGAHDAVTVSQ